MSFLTSSLNKLSLRKPRHSHEPDADDVGEEISSSTIAGGGRLSSTTQSHRAGLRISQPLQRFLVDRGVISTNDVTKENNSNSEGLKRALSAKYSEIPREWVDMGYALPEYFVSSSHNTYLMAHQLYGTSSASAYETALRTGSRCVEIDAWDNEDNLEEPKVTHGYTLVSHIPIRAVAETIKQVMQTEESRSPIFISLENHCSQQGQQAIVCIFEEVFGDLLLKKALEKVGKSLSDEHVTLSEIGHRVLVIVEYHLANEKEESSDSGSSSDNSSEDEGKKVREEYKKRKKAQKEKGIIPELAALGVYAQSVKPVDNSWFDPGTLLNGPHHHLINISETGLSRHMPAASEKIAWHNTKHLMRVFPKGTRISSKNLEPVKYWSLGAQICALNWQTFNGGMQLNEALFSGTDGYVLKPMALRAGGSGNVLSGKRQRFKLHIAGASNLVSPKEYGPNTEGGPDWKPYVTCNLVSPGKCYGPRKQKTSVYRVEHKLALLHQEERPPATDPMWDETLEWEYDGSEMVFLRILIKADLSWKVNPNLRVVAVRLGSLILNEWRFLHLTDFKGAETEAVMLVRFEVEDL